MKQKAISALLLLLLAASGCSAADSGLSAGSGSVPDASGSRAGEEIPQRDDAEAETGYANYEQLFEGDQVIDIHVTISQEDWQSILDSPLDKEYKNVSVVVSDVALDNVGFSTKGNSTLRTVAGSSETDRYSFRLKFDKFDKEQTLLGLDKLSLNNNLTDASYLREYLHYEALRLAGVPTPHTVFVNLYINGELYGLYTGVENEDKSFLQRNFGADYASGVLYDTEEKANLLYEESEEYRAYTYETGAEDDKASLRQFIRVLNDMPVGEKGGIESVLDVDSALAYIAANTVFGNYDSYNGEKAHNYKLYGDADGKFTVIPWDFNMSFGGFAMGGGDAVAVSIDEPISGTTMDKAPLIQNLLAVPEYKERYLEYIRLFTDYLEGIEGRANQLADLIRPHVEADPTKFYTVEAFESNLLYNENEAVRGILGVDSDNPQGFPGEPPEGFTPPEMEEGRDPPGFGGDRSEGDGPGSRGERGGPGRQGGGGPGGGLMSASGSLVTFAQNRLENLREQLAASA